MIRVVADTHALIWALLGDPRLSAAARSALSVTGSDQVGVSAITLVEIVYLEEKRRIPPGVFARISDVLAAPAGVLAEVPVDATVVQAMSRVPRDGISDMPDRIIAATALHLGVPLVSRDAKIQASNVTTIW
jgi:PIN domain nuclease of toxin-antitoxin system